jgi:fatty acid desaturase
MPAWTGWLWIALGAYLTWRDSRLLASRPYRREQLSRAGRTARREALTSLRFSLFCIANGVAWLAGWLTHPMVAWLYGGYLFVLVTYDLTAWRRSRNRCRSAGQTAELS